MLAAGTKSATVSPAAIVTVWLRSLVVIVRALKRIDGRMDTPVLRTGRYQIGVRAPIYQPVVFRGSALY